MYGKERLLMVVLLVLALGTLISAGGIPTSHGFTLRSANELALVARAARGEPQQSAA